MAAPASVVMSTEPGWIGPMEGSWTRRGERQHLAAAQRDALGQPVEGGELRGRQPQARGHGGGRVAALRHGDLVARIGDHAARVGGRARLGRAARDLLGERRASEVEVEPLRARAEQRRHGERPHDAGAGARTAALAGAGGVGGHRRSSIWPRSGGRRGGGLAGSVAQALQQRHEADGPQLLVVEPLGTARHLHEPLHGVRLPHRGRP